MILKALNDFLTYDADLSSCNEPFEQPIPAGLTTIVNRNDARRKIRHEIGNAIYAGRIPQTAKHTAVALSHVSSSREYHLRGEYDLKTAIVQVDVFSRGNGAAIRCPYIAGLIGIATSSFAGSDWSQSQPVEVATVNIIRENDLSTRASDGSDDWTHRHSMDLEIKYATPAAPSYPNAPSVPAFLVSVDGSRMILLDSSSIAPGRTLVLLEWTADDGVTSIAWSGLPDAPVVEANVSGIYRDCEVDTVGAGLTGSVTVTLVATDTEGDQITAENTVAI